MNFNEDYEIWYNLMQFDAIWWQFDEILFKFWWNLDEILGEIWIKFQWYSNGILIKSLWRRKVNEISKTSIFCYP